jgi:hypothetical protein
MVLMPVFAYFSGFVWHLWAVVGSCGRFLVLSPVSLGFIGFSLGNHYLICVQKVWLRVVKTWIEDGFSQFFCRVPAESNQVTWLLPRTRFLGRGGSYGYCGLRNAFSTRAGELPASRGRRRAGLVATLSLLAGLMLGAGTAVGQGCAQCRDNTAATPPQTQAAYRHAIELLAGTAGAVFAGTVWLLRRQR